MSGNMPQVALVGRPNVGKSTLFNRLTRSRSAIVDPTPGVTRDLKQKIMEWNGYSFNLIDTGGFVPKTLDEIEIAVREQAIIALEDSDLVIFMVDARTGITDFDTGLANIIRKHNKQYLLAVNKSDDETVALNASEFFALGLGNPYPVSAETGYNTGDLLDMIVEKIPKRPWTEPLCDLKLAFVGRPNVGKSSLTNLLASKEISIVHEKAGTTRDSIDTFINYQKQRVMLIDTAGLRKRSKVRENIEFYSALRSERAVQTAEVVIVVADAQFGLEKQDLNILEKAERMQRGIIVAFNKWDLAPDKNTRTPLEYEAVIREKLGAYEYVPMIFISVHQKQRVFKMLDLALEIKQKFRQKITTSKLNNYLLPIIRNTPPPTVSNQLLKINYIVQEDDFPRFFLFCNKPELIPSNYRRFIEHKIREKFDYSGVPIRLILKSKYGAADEIPED